MLDEQIEFRLLFTYKLIEASVVVHTVLRFHKKYLHLCSEDEQKYMSN